jgi:two-component system OmpR family sensor kinase
MIEAASAFLMLVLPLVALLLWGLRRITAEAAAPISALASAVAARRPDDLSPVAADGLPRELLPLAQAFDGYLTRIEALRRAERDFVANAAHELRTPLAAIRGRLQLSADPDAAAAVPMIDALTRRVERLLQLARLEAGVGLGSGPADALRVLRLLIDDLRPTARQAIRFDDSDLETLTIAADPDALAILLRNILENAVEHGTGPVLVRLTPEGVLSVENPTQATGLPAGRFDKSRDSAGQGLGLAIVADLARAMGAPLEQGIAEGRARVTLRLPLAG